jgi:phosphate starvation-inducible PhoH-like protein
MSKRASANKVLNRDVFRSTTVEEKQEKPIEIKPVTAKSDNQKLLLRTIKNKIITFVFGSAGSGKSFISTAMGIDGVARGDFNKLVVTRPVVTACNEQLGFLPGGEGDKLYPFIRPIYWIIDELLEPDQAKKFKAEKIEVIPLGFCRGLTFNDKYILADEMQNAPIELIHMLLTRIGKNSKLVLNGDMSQCDLPLDMRGGLSKMASVLRSDSEVGVVEFQRSDIVRNPIITRILDLLEASEKPRSLEQFYAEDY